MADIEAAPAWQLGMRAGTRYGRQLERTGEAFVPENPFVALRPGERGPKLMDGSRFRITDALADIIQHYAEHGGVVPVDHLADLLDSYSEPECQLEHVQTEEGVVIG